MQSKSFSERRAGVVLSALLILWLAVAACTPTPAPSASGQGLSAQDVWARPAKTMGDAPMEGDTQPMQHGGANSAVYMRLTNDGAAADRLTAARADVSHAVEIHETVMEGDVMRMQQVQDGIEIPAGGQIELKPGSYHIMLIGLTRDLAVGDTFPVRLEFASGEKLTVEAEVRQP
ncbi:MAG TPA: copper chaperone PCu(A)C [Anaerolineae bacterium]|nr:copper chaperone PCu(A)C [Anaerolineae bacterium]HNU04960.1 copper chaperone PCu(A)C [Anaerolineae bacterium]